MTGSLLGGAGPLNGGGELGWKGGQLVAEETAGWIKPNSLGLLQDNWKPVGKKNYSWVPMGTQATSYTA
jgi:hypothetical protein